MSDRFGTAARRLAVAYTAAGLVQAGSALATLELRDINGTPTTNSAVAEFAYDTVLDATWYLTINNSFLDLYDAYRWATTLTVGKFGGWMLPTADPACGSQSVNCTSSQMGELYYTELGNQAGGPMSNTGPFKNLWPFHYWSSTAVFNHLGNNTQHMWVFNFSDGSQDTWFRFADSLYTLAVRPGDVAAVPEPATLLLIGAGMLGLVWTRHSRRRH